MAQRVPEVHRAPRTTDLTYGNLVIGGRIVQTEQARAISDPAAPEQLVGYAASATEEQARDAVAAAHRAWPAWSALEPERRGQLLRSALSVLDADFEQRTELLVRENGKVRSEAEVEIRVFAWRCELAAGLAAELTKVRELPPLVERPATGLQDSGYPRRVQRYQAPPFRSLVSSMSLGVVTIVVPYNWPLAILAASLPYALMAGNTVVVKPPPTSPLCVMRTIELLASKLPAGVLNLVFGTNEAVAPIISDPRVRRIVFTGSTTAGKAIMATAASNVTRITLELGGNDPAFVLDDAVLDRSALERLVMGSFMTAGQVCMGIKRVYVHRSRFDQLVTGMSDILAGYRIGHGLSASTTMGPLNNARQREFVLGLCQEARALGHEVRELGTLQDDASPDGYFLRPSLVLDPAPDERIVVEEQFGPALPILRYDDINPVIERVNDEWAGLCSSVWTSNPIRATDVAQRLRTGTTWVNSANAIAQDDRAPFGGFRQSGLGRELGTEGLREFTELHTVTYPG